MTDSESGSVRVRPIVLAVLGIIVFQGLFLAFAYWVLGGEWERLGQFGDVFGAVNALYSGLALAAVALAVFLQSKELRLQRKELGLQREELKQTRHELSRAAEAQEAVLEIQQRHEAREIFPKLVLTGRNPVIHPFRFKLRNTGAQALNPVANGPVTFENPGHPWSPQENRQFEIAHGQIDVASSVRVSIDYVALDGEERSYDVMIRRRDEESYHVEIADE